MSDTDPPVADAVSAAHATTAADPSATLPVMARGTVAQDGGWVLDPVVAQQARRTVYNAQRSAAAWIIGGSR